MASRQSNIIWILLVSFFAVRSTEYDCTWSHANASFDLCAWRQTVDSQGDGYWEVYDDGDSSKNNYTYKFNICGDVINTDNLNELCTNNTLRDIKGFPIGFCSDIMNGTDGINKCQCINETINGTTKCNEKIEAININTASYQMPRKKTDKDCYRLHDGITPPIFSLIDESDPTIGVSIKYEGGDWCKKFGKNREFIINFYCSSNYENVPDRDEKISEPVHDPSDEGSCTYILEIDSSIGCPIQCPIENEKLCGGNGICQYDETNKYPKCFCYDGYFGESCISTIHNDGKYIFLLVVVIICLTLLSLITIYLLIRVYKSKMLNYNNSSQENIAMQINSNQTSIQQKKKIIKSKLKSSNSSKLTEPLAQQQHDDDNNEHPIVV